MKKKLHMLLIRVIGKLKQKMFYRVEKGKTIHHIEDADEADLGTENGEGTPQEIDIDTKEIGGGVEVETGTAKGATGVGRSIAAGHHTNTGRLWKALSKLKSQTVVVFLSFF